MSGGALYAGASLIDLSDRGQLANFMLDAGPYYPDEQLATLGAGARAIEGPSGAGSNLFSYSIRMTTTINGISPVVPAIEDISVSYLPVTEILYCYER